MNAHRRGKSAEPHVLELQGTRFERGDGDFSGLAEPGARCRPEDLVAGFDLARLPPTPVRLEPAAVAALLG